MPKIKMRQAALVAGEWREVGDEVEVEPAEKLNYIMTGLAEEVEEKKSQSSSKKSK